MSENPVSKWSNNGTLRGGASRWGRSHRLCWQSVRDALVGWWQLQHSFPTPVGLPAPLPFPRPVATQTLKLWPQSSLYSPCLSIKLRNASSTERYWCSWICTSTDRGSGWYPLSMVGAVVLDLSEKNISASR